MNDYAFLKYEVILHWLAVFFYILAAISFIQGVIFAKEGALSRGWWFVMAGLFPHAAAILFRWFYLGHGPYLVKHEILSSNAWIALVVFLAVSRRYPRLRFTGMVVAPLSFLAIGLGLFTDLSLKRLPPTFENVWLFFHIIFAKLASGAFLIALVLSIAYCLKILNVGFRFLARLPKPELLDEYIYKFVAFGFCFWTIMIAAGSIWAHQSWGRYWGWDPMETWSLIAWLMFGAYLHLRLFFNWRGMKGVIFLFVSFAVSFVTVFFLPFLVKSLHSEYLM